MAFSMNVSDSIQYVGVDDEDLVLFENQYDLRPIGVTYNSYVILDEKITIMDTVDKRCTREWIGNLQDVLDGRKPYYLVVSHMEPDHAANIVTLITLYPDIIVVGNVSTFKIIDKFFGKDAISAGNRLEVKNGDVLDLGSHKLQFLFAPMVHWPEVMTCYESTEKVFFSADAFGRFGTMSKTALAPWLPQARRYFYNIVGKYHKQVQKLLKDVEAFDIKTICPLHGPVLSGDLSIYLDAYNRWSSDEAENPNMVFIVFASIYGNTGNACQELAKILSSKGVPVTVCDLVTCDLSYALVSAFACGKIVFAASTYDGNIFTPMEDYINRLAHKDFRNRKVGIIENGCWSPISGKMMDDRISCMKNMSICPTRVTLNGALSPASREDLVRLADEISG